MKWPWTGFNLKSKESKPFQKKDSVIKQKGNDTSPPIAIVSEWIRIFFYKEVNEKNKAQSRIWGSWKHL